MEHGDPSLQVPEDELVLCSVLEVEDVYSGLNLQVVSYFLVSLQH